MSVLRDDAGNTIEIPSMAKIASLMRNNKWVKRNYPIIKAYVVGSVARGCATTQSDIDIALVIAPVKGKDALRVTEDYHGRFSRDYQKPHFKNRRLDLQFFYENDPALANYTKIDIIADGETNA